MKENIKVSVVAGVVICQDGKYLLVQEGIPGDSIYGLWNLPAGKVKEGESLEDAAIREAKEETGLEVKLLKKLDIFQEYPQESVKHAFEAKIVGGELLLSSEEIMDVKWFSFDEILAMRDKLRSNWILNAIKSSK